MELSSKTKELAEGLRQALLAERAGSEFYKVAAAQTKDPGGKKVFEELAEEETRHFEYLSGHYKAVLATGALAQGLTLSEAHQFGTNNPIFSSELKGRLKYAHFEMSALAIAAQLELNALTHYRRMAERAQTPEARKLFEDFVEWESAHYDAFVKQQQELQEEYWNEAGFEPF
jgi:rubrerythrin